MANHRRIGIESIALKSELFLFFLGSSSIGFILALVLFALFRLGWQTLAVQGACLIFNFVLYRIWRRVSSRLVQGAVYNLFCFVYSCVIWPFLFFLGGGIAGAAPIFYILLIMETVLLLDNLAVYFCAGLSAAEFIACMVLDHLHPEIAESFVVLGKRAYLLIPLTIVFVGLTVGEAFRMMRRNFEENRRMSNELLQQIRESAQKDPLTGTYDRAFMHDYLTQCKMQTDSGAMKVFSVIMFDIDWFKSINDRFGHLVGDECLRSLTDTVRAHLRPDDIITRYGGEEFLCVLPNAGDATAFRRADEIRREVSSRPLLDDMGGEIVTISCGVCQYEPGMSIELLLRSVDSNLYLAKRRGRNCVVWHDGLPFQDADFTAPNPYAAHNRRTGDKK